MQLDKASIVSWIEKLKIQDEDGVREKQWYNFACQDIMDAINDGRFDLPPQQKADERFIDFPLPYGHFLELQDAADAFRWQCGQCGQFNYTAHWSGCPKCATSNHSDL